MIIFIWVSRKFGIGWGLGLGLGLELEGNDVETGAGFWVEVVLVLGNLNRFEIEFE